MLNNHWRYEILVKKDAVGALVEDKDQRILLVKQFRPALLRETWEIPAGVMDKDGLDEKAIIVEELLEEANLQGSKKQLDYLISFMPEMGISSSKIHLYYTKIDVLGLDQSIIDDLDVTAIKWFSHKELEKEIAEGNLLDVKTLLAYYYLKK